MPLSPVFPAVARASWAENHYEVS